MTDLKFDVPDSKTPGYLKRAKDALEFQEKMKDGLTPNSIDEMVEWLAQFVSEPEDEQEKRDALWMASEDQYKELLSAITGGDENPTS